MVLTTEQNYILKNSTVSFFPETLPQLLCIIQTSVGTFFWKQVYAWIKKRAEIGKKQSISRKKLFLEEWIQGFYQNILLYTLVQVVPSITMHLRGSLQATNGRQRFSLNEVTWEENETSCQLCAIVLCGQFASLS